MISGQKSFEILEVFFPVLGLDLVRSQISVRVISFTHPSFLSATNRLVMSGFWMEYSQKILPSRFYSTFCTMSPCLLSCCLRHSSF